jgi:predicted esterase YcpF (UPF0227 family)
MPDPMSLTTSAYGKFLDDHIRTHYHDITQLRAYPNIKNQEDSTNWQKVKIDFPALIGVGLGGHMRLEWRGTIWAPPGPNRPHSAA